MLGLQTASAELALIQAGAAVRLSRRAGALIVAALREQSWFVTLVLAYLAAGFAVAWAYGQRPSLELYGRVHITLYANFALAFLIVRWGRLLLAQRPARPLAFLWHELRHNELAPQRLATALPAFLLLPLLLSMVTSLKRMITLIEPFRWDPALAELDRVLHGGQAPWALLQPLLGEPAISYALSLAYSAPWFGLMLLVQFWQTFTLDPRRNQFLISYVVCWVLLGNVLATLLSSAGPCYYGDVVGGADPFAPLMAYLETTSIAYPLPSLLAQEYLWTNFQEDYLRLGAGISAMPSLHIAMGCLALLAIWPLHWGLRFLGGLYLVVLLIGSVHLGWHYAVDGYAAIAATLAIWWAVGRALAWHRR